MEARRIVHTTVTGQPPSDEGRDYVPTRDQRRRPYSLDRPQRDGGQLDRHIKLAPAILMRAKQLCKERGVRLSDCRFYPDGAVRIP